MWCCHNGIAASISETNWMEDEGAGEGFDSAIYARTWHSCNLTVVVSKWKWDADRRRRQMEPGFYPTDPVLRTDDVRWSWYDVAWSCDEWKVDKRLVSTITTIFSIIIIYKRHRCKCIYEWRKEDRNDAGGREGWRGGRLERSNGGWGGAVETTGEPLHGRYKTQTITIIYAACRNKPIMFNFQWNPLSPSIKSRATARQLQQQQSQQGGSSIGSSSSSSSSSSNSNNNTRTAAACGQQQQQQQHWSSSSMGAATAAAWEQQQHWGSSSSSSSSSNNNKAAGSIVAVVRMNELMNWISFASWQINISNPRYSFAIFSNTCTNNPPVQSKRWRHCTCAMLLLACLYCCPCSCPCPFPCSCPCPARVPANARAPVPSPAPSCPCLCFFSFPYPFLTPSLAQPLLTAPAHAWTFFGGFRRVWLGVCSVWTAAFRLFSADFDECD